MKSSLKIQTKSKTNFKNSMKIRSMTKISKSDVKLNKIVLTPQLLLPSPSSIILLLLVLAKVLIE